MKKILLSFCLISCSALAAYDDPNESYLLSPEEQKPTNEEILLKKPEKYLQHESMISHLNKSLGIRDERRYSGEDHNKFSGTFHARASYEYFSDLQSMEITYAHRSQSWLPIWWGATYKMTHTNFGTITQNPSGSSSNPNADSALKRSDSATQNISTFGLGAGYRFKLFLNFFETKDVYEMVNAYLTYNLLKESFIGQTYKGYGLTADYSLHKRTRLNFFYGGKFSYNIAYVTRAARGGESASDRSLPLGWFSMGLEMGYFF